MKDRSNACDVAARFLALMILVFAAGSACADDPVADGLSEERTGMVERIDASAGLIVVAGRVYRLLDEQNVILPRIVGDSNAGVLDESVDLTSIDAGDRIRYAVDLMSAQSGDGEAILFVLGVQ